MSARELKTEKKGNLSSNFIRYTAVAQSHMIYCSVAEQQISAKKLSKNLNNMDL